MAEQNGVVLTEWFDAIVHDKQMFIAVPISFVVITPKKKYKNNIKTHLYRTTIAGYKHSHVILEYFTHLSILVLANNVIKKFGNLREPEFYISKVELDNN